MLLDYVVEFWGNNWNLCLYTQTTANTEFRKHKAMIELQNTFTYRIPTVCKPSLSGILTEVMVFI